MALNRTKGHMLLAKIVLTNIIVFLVAISSLEIFFRIYDRIVPFQPEKVTWDHSNEMTTDEADVIQELGVSILEPLPSDVVYSPDGKLSKYNYSDVDFENAYRSEKRLPLQGTFREQVKIKNSDIIVSDIVYETVGFRRRKVENQSRKTNTKRFVLALGCSLTFGYAVTQGLDYPSQLAKKIDDSWKVYNWGVPGGTLSNYFDSARKDQSMFSVKEHEGALVWMFTYDHLERFFCYRRCYSHFYDWIQRKTNYKIEDNNFVAKGRFSQSWEPARVALSFFSLSSIFQRLVLAWNDHYSETDYYTFARGLSEIAGQIRDRKIRKYVVIYDDFSEYPMLKKALLAYGFEPIEFFKINGVLKIKNPLVVLDGHPSSETYWYVSEVIKNRLNKDFTISGPIP